MNRVELRSPIFVFSFSPQMEQLSLHAFHEAHGGKFIELSGLEAVSDYGKVAPEYAALRESAAVLDLSFRGRICLTGADRVRFLHGQVTNEIKALRFGQGCYAALVNAKGRMQGDLCIYALADELLLDYEPGLTPALSQRFEKFIVSDDVQVVDVAPHYGLLCVQGPKAAEVIRSTGSSSEMPSASLAFTKATDATLGELYLMNHPRIGTVGFDLFVPLPAMQVMATKLLDAAKTIGGGLCGWEALEIARIEAGIPRYGADMDESNLPQECGIEASAVSYSKGCYIGQEVLNRVHTMGHVNKELRGLRLGEELKALPTKGDKLFQGDKEVGYITSAVVSPALKATIALGFVRREANSPGTELTLHTAGKEKPAVVVATPFC